MPNIAAMTIDEKVEYYHKYFQEQAQDYPKDVIREGIELLSYKKKGAPKEMPKEESDTESTLYVFRHGESLDNTNFLFSGWRDPELTDKGREQALILADKLKDKKIHFLISSPQKRAMETMGLAISKNDMAKNLDINTDLRLRERNYGDFQGKSKIEIYLEQGPEELAQIRRSYDKAPPNGESIKMTCERVAEFCEELLPRMRETKLNVAISCSGNSIRGFRRYFEPDLTNDEIAKLETPLGQDYLAYVIR